MERVKSSQRSGLQSYDPFSSHSHACTAHTHCHASSPAGLLITFDIYQVTSGASGPVQVLEPSAQLKDVIDPQEVLAGYTP